ncbi:hypothetical protein ACH474_12200 [Nocardia rhamnosiphila]|uniref:hypothetical protein n=1 Tax=Nocardia rhamnosiphila TaxID=426716 RepID=UPI0037A7CA0A
MPSQHRFPVVTVRVDPALHERAKVAVSEVDSNLNAHVVAFLRWLVHDTDELPARPVEPGTHHR